MAQGAMSVCRTKGCSKAHSNAHAHCDAHEQNRHGWSKTSSSSRGYGHQWRKARKAALERDKGMCKPCKSIGVWRAATEVDHIINKAQGGTDELDNLQSICRQCHQSKTSSERR